ETEPTRPRPERAKRSEPNERPKAGRPGRARVTPVRSRPRGARPMAQFYTLEEAARVLGMSPEELKAKAQHREVRAFLDGGSWRFPVADVDELARRRGLGSDAELPLSDLELPATNAGEGGAALDLSEFQMGAANPALGAPTAEVAHHTPPGPS